MGIIGLLIAAALVLGPLAVVFALVCTAIKVTFKLTFWVLELVAVIVVGAIFGGSILAFVGVLLALNIVAVPCFLLFARR